MTACKPIILIVIHVKNKNAYIIATGFFSHKSIAIENCNMPVL